METLWKLSMETVPYPESMVFGRTRNFWKKRTNWRQFSHWKVFLIKNQWKCCQNQRFRAFVTFPVLFGELNLPYTTVYQILTNKLGKYLSQEGKDIRKERCLDFWEQLNMFIQVTRFWWLSITRKPSDRAWIGIL